MTALDDFITILKNKGDVIVCWDFKAKDGDEHDFILNDDYMPQTLRNRNIKIRSKIALTNHNSSTY